MLINTTNALSTISFQYGIGFDYHVYVAIANATERWSPIVSPIACFTTIFLFWGFAASRYLRLPRPWLVALALVVLAGLAATALLALWPGLLQGLFYKNRYD